MGVQKPVKYTFRLFKLTLLQKQVRADQPGIDVCVLQVERLFR